MAEKIGLIHFQARWRKRLSDLASLSVCFCYGRFSFLSTKPRHNLGRMSLKLRVVCPAKHVTLLT